MEAKTKVSHFFEQPKFETWLVSTQKCSRRKGNTEMKTETKKNSKL